MQIGEFAIASREYPIVFLRRGEGVAPVAILGLAEGENLFVSGDGDWQASYIPAFLRLYPFVMANVAETDRMLLGIASDHPGLNTEGRGFGLFEDGEPSKLIQDAQEFAKRFAEQSKLTERFSAEIEKLDILTPIGVKMKGPDAAERAVGGMYVVDRKKLSDLDDAVLHGMVKSGALEAIYLHLSSVQNLRDLAKRLGHETELPDAEDGLTVQSPVSGSA